MAEPDDADQPDPSQGDGIEERKARPALTTILGSLAIIVLAAASLNNVGGKPLSYMLGAAFGQALIIWAICYAVSLRRASRGWKIAAFAIFLAISLLITMGKAGGANIAAREDAADAVEGMEAMLESGNMWAVTAGKGPMASMSAAAVASLAADQRAFDEDLKASHMLDIVQSTRLREATTPQNCTRIAALEGQARHFGARWPVHITAARNAGEAIVAKGGYPSNSVTSFIDGMTEGKDSHVQRWVQNATMAREASAMCRMLASESWHQKGGILQFADAANNARYDRHVAAYNQAFLAQQAAAEASMKRSKSEIEKMKGRLGAN